MSIIIDYDKCCWKDGSCQSCSCEKACVGCVEACPVQAITRENIVKINTSECIECGACVSACKHQALSLA
jgi:Fe-S-cluster-containing hydrogenase component 2